MMLHGGNGILNNFSCLPRLLNDSIINETWEGTHQIITMHVLKAYSRPRIKHDINVLVSQAIENAENVQELDYARKILSKKQQVLANITLNSAVAQTNRTLVADYIYEVITLSEWIKLALQEEEVFIGFATGFAELIDPDKPLSGILNNEAWLDRIINY